MRVGLLLVSEADLEAMEGEGGAAEDAGGSGDGETSGAGGDGDGDGDDSSPPQVRGCGRIRGVFAVVECCVWWSIEPVFVHAVLSCARVLLHCGVYIRGRTPMTCACPNRHVLVWFCWCVGGRRVLAFFLTLKAPAASAALATLPRARACFSGDKSPFFAAARKKSHPFAPTSAERNGAARRGHSERRGR